VNTQETPNRATVRFLREQATPVTRTYNLLPRQRLTVDGSGIPDLLHRSFGMDVTFDDPAVAERAMYFRAQPALHGRPRIRGSARAGERVVPRGRRDRPVL